MYKRAKYHLEQLEEELNRAEYWEDEATSEKYFDLWEDEKEKVKGLKKEIKELELRHAQLAVKYGKLLKEREDG